MWVAGIFHVSIPYYKNEIKSGNFFPSAKMYLSKWLQEELHKDKEILNIQNIELFLQAMITEINKNLDTSQMEQCKNEEREIYTNGICDMINLESIYEMDIFLKKIT